MKIQMILLALAAAAGWGDCYAASGPNSAAATDRLLQIDSCSMPVAEGKATLIVGSLQRTNGIYAGEYKIKVFPYFFKNDKGRLAILVSDAALAAASQVAPTLLRAAAATSGLDASANF